MAMTRSGLIGKGLDLPWKIREEMNYFRKITLGKTVILGWNTFASFRFKPLPERTNIVLSRLDNSLTNIFKSPSSWSSGSNLFFFSDYQALVSQYRGHSDRHAFVIGGKNVFSQFFPFLDAISVSWIKGDFEGDVYFADLDGLDIFHSLWVKSFDFFEAELLVAKKICQQKTLLKQLESIFYFSNLAKIK